jgi:phenol 2-monooxygenase
VRTNEQEPGELTFRLAFPSTGRYRILVLCSDDLMDLGGRSAKALEESGKLVEACSPGLVELVVLHPLTGIRGCEFKALPPAVVEHAEMQLFSAAVDEMPVGKDSKEQWRAEDAYDIFGVDKRSGRVALIRPDGYVAAMDELDKVGGVAASLRAVVIVKDGQSYVASTK